MNTLVVFVDGAEGFTVTDAFPMRIAHLLRRLEEDEQNIVVRCMQNYSGRGLLQELSEDRGYTFSAATRQSEIADANMLIYFDDGSEDLDFLTPLRVKVRVKVLPVGGPARLRRKA